MGQHCWLLLATIITEILVIAKWSKGMFSEPLPATVKWGWAAGAFVLIFYPIKTVSPRISMISSEGLIWGS